MSRIKKSLFPPISLYLFLVKKTVEIVSLFLIDYFWSLRGTGNRESQVFIPLPLFTDLTRFEMTYTSKIYCQRSGALLGTYINSTIKNYCQLFLILVLQNQDPRIRFVASWFEPKPDRCIAPIITTLCVACFIFLGSCVASIHVDTAQIMMLYGSVTGSQAHCLQWVPHRNVPLSGNLVGNQTNSAKVSGLTQQPVLLPQDHSNTNLC